MKPSDTPRPQKLGLALAGGGPLGAMYELGVLLALDEALIGLDLNDMDVYVGVSAGSFIGAALANQLTPREIYRLFIDDETVSGRKGRHSPEFLRPEMFMRPAWREYLRSARRVPALAWRGAKRLVAAPMRRSPVEAFASLFSAIPTGLFENEALARYARKTFRHSGRTDDFTKLKHRLYTVAVDVDTGQTVPFGAPGWEHIPISKAIQASAAWPGLYPPVEINGHFYADGALTKTMHASLALEYGAKLVLCINPLAPYSADAGQKNETGKQKRLVDGGLPAVLSQTFRTMIHSRMQTGLESYARRYPDANVILFEPARHDGQMFFSNLFSYANRKSVCEHAYQQIRRDLLRRQHELTPVLQAFGITLDVDALKDESRTLDQKVFRRGKNASTNNRVTAVKLNLAESLADLEGFLKRESSKV